MAVAEDYVWVFNGDRARFPSAVFSSREKAEAWISAHALSGTLTRYPLDQGVYEWAMEQGYFTPTRERHTKATFIQSFSSAYQEHYHYVAESGEEVSSNEPDHP